MLYFKTPFGDCFIDGDKITAVISCNTGELAVYNVSEGSKIFLDNGSEVMVYNNPQEVLSIMRRGAQ